MARLNIKRSVFQLVLGVAFLALLSVSTISCEKDESQPSEEGELQLMDVSWAYDFNDVETMTETADIIVIGTVENVAVVSEEVIGEPRWGDDVLYHTGFSLRVEEILKGECKDTIVVYQTGKPGVQEIRDDPLIKVGEQALLFLTEYKPDHFRVIGGPQGRYIIHDDHASSLNYEYPERNIYIPQGIDFSKKDIIEFEALLKDIMLNINNS